MGDADLVKPILRRGGRFTSASPDEAGQAIDFRDHREGLWAEDAVFGLPGNPVSSYVTFNLVVVPAFEGENDCPVPPPIRPTFSDLLFSLLFFSQPRKRSWLGGKSPCSRG